MTEVPWYRRWFGEEYLQLYPHRDEDEAARAVTLLVARVPLAPGPVLDLGSGAGRHLRALEGHGVRGIGLDLSFPLLRCSLEEAPGLPVVRADMRAVPFPDHSFAAVTSFFTSFGYFSDAADDGRVVAEIRRVLRPGGHLFLDFLNAGTVRASLTPKDERMVAGRRVVQERRLVDDGRVVEKSIRIDGGTDRGSQHFRERVRLYDAEELEALLAGQAFEVRDRFGDYGGGPFREGSPRVILLARAP